MMFPAFAIEIGPMGAGKVVPYSRQGGNGWFVRWWRFPAGGSHDGFGPLGGDSGVRGRPSKGIGSSGHALVSIHPQAERTARDENRTAFGWFLVVIIVVGLWLVPAIVVVPQKLLDREEGSSAGGTHPTGVLLDWPGHDESAHPIAVDQVG